MSRRLERAGGLEKRSAVGVGGSMGVALGAESGGVGGGVGLRGAASGMGKKREGGTNGLRYIRGEGQGESRRRLVEWTWCECWVACCFGPVVPRYPGEPGCEGSSSKQWGKRGSRATASRLFQRVANTVRASPKSGLASCWCCCFMLARRGTGKGTMGGDEVTCAGRVGGHGGRGWNKGGTAGDGRGRL